VAIAPQKLFGLFSLSFVSMAIHTAFLFSMIGTPMSIVNLPDGSKKEYDRVITPAEIAAEIGPRLAKAVLAAEIDGNVVGLDYKIPIDAEVSLKLLTKKDAESLGVMRHSCAHVMARAIMRIHEGVKLAFGPTIDGGFYYDFDLEHSLSDEDFPAIEKEMRKIVQQNEPFERIDVGRDEAVKICRDMDQSFKVEHIEGGLGEHDTVSFYRQGEFLDLCRGPHIPGAGAIGAFKIQSVAGAYWKGDQSRKQLQRVYATAFFSQKDLDAHLEKIEEAKKRDHRVLGKKHDLFSISPLVGQGLVLWHPKGAMVRSLLETFVKDELQKRDYQPVYTPNIGKVDLYETSGHFPYYGDSMYAPIVMDQEEQYILKPMNCPHHIMIYKSRPRSYRELPLRLAEFGTVYRYEQSGELSGMTRVRGFTQDDAHIFCTNEQVADEFKACIEMTQFVLQSLGMTSYRVRLGFRDPTSDKYVGDAQLWDKAQSSLVRVCQELGIDVQIEEGEAAFYGPKADFVVSDCLGREWQLGTVQLDYNLPSADRFKLDFVGGDNERHRPVMIHRAPLGSLERFMGVLIEHFAAAFPLWLAPEQVRVLTISEKFTDYGKEVLRQLRAAGFRATGEFRPEKVNAKIRDAQIELIPYMFVIGEREVENGSVAVRDRIEGNVGAMKIDEAIKKLHDEVSNRVVRQSFTSNVSMSDRGTDNMY
jgi:threonyl-tRNA synthetase